MGAIVGANIINTSLRASAVLRSEVRFNLKKIILFSILALFYAAGCGAAEYWTWQNPKMTWNPTRQTIRGVYFVDDNTGYAVAGLGEIYKTTAGGTGSPNFATTTTAFGVVAYDLDFPVDANTGYAVGGNGLIRKTVNAGATWNAPPSTGVTDTLNAVDFPIDNSIGYTVGNNGVILKTADGTNWATQTSGVTAALRSVHFPGNATIGYAVGDNGTVLKTTNGGAAWSTMPVPAAFAARAFYSVNFPANSTTTGYIAGANSSILKTTDGATWYDPMAASVTAYTLLDIHCPVDATACFAAGYSGTVFKTTNGGANWTRLTTPTAKTLTALYFRTNSLGYAVGSAGLAMKTTDGGANWTVLATTINSNIFYTVQFPDDAGTGFALGEAGKIFKTTDRGTTWTAKTSGLSAAYYIKAANFPAGESTGYAVGASSSVLFTSDAGETWSSKAANGPYYSVCFPENASTGYAVGGAGKIDKFTNTGASFSWTSQTSGVAVTLNSVHFPVDNNTGFVAGNGGTILKTTNGGTTWTAKTSGTAENLQQIYFPADATTGYAVGNNGAARITADGGETWAAMTTGVAVNLKSIVFPQDANTGYIAGTGKILQTTNGGSSWTADSAVISADDNFNFIAFPYDSYYGYAAGDEGMILARQEGSYYSDAAVPAVVNNQSNVPGVNTSTRTYNVDFTDSGGSHLSRVEIEVCSTAAMCADIAPWTKTIARMGGVDSYTADWQFPPAVWNTLSASYNYISARVYDGEGNVTATGPLFYVMKDSTPPAATVTFTPSATNTWQTSDLVLSASETDSGSGLYYCGYTVENYKPASASWVTSKDWTSLNCSLYATSSSATAAVTVGSAKDCGYEGSSYCRVTFQAQDAASNTYMATATFNIDWATPDITINSPAASSWQKADFAVSLNFSDSSSGLSACKYKVDSDSVSTLGWTDLGCSTSTFASSPVITVGAAGNCRDEGSGKCVVTIFASDTAGNNYTATRAFSVDWTPPSATGTPTPWAYASGSFVSAAYSLTENGISDAAGGVLTCEFATDGSAWNAVASYTAYAPSCAAAAACSTDGSTQTLAFKFTDAAGNSTQTATAAWYCDATPPVPGSVTPSNTESADRLFVDSVFDVSAAFSDGDGSLVNSCEYYCASSPSGSCANEGAWTAATWTAGTCWASATTVAGCADGATMTLNMRALDNVSYYGTAAQIARKCDAAAPSCSITQLSYTAPNVYATGTSAVWYCNSASCGGAAGFTAYASSTDSVSGVAKVNFPSSLNGNLTGCGDVSTSALSVYSCAFNFSAAAPTQSSTSAVETSYDQVGYTSSCSFLYINDNSAPSGGSINYTNGDWPSSSASISYATGTDGAGSGVSARFLESRSAAYSGGACGAFGAWATLTAIADPALSSYSATGLSSGSCYEFRLIETDNVSNSAAFSSTHTLKVDFTPPYISAMSPATDTWQTSDFAVSATFADSTGGVATCGYMVESYNYAGSAWVTTSPPASVSCSAASSTTAAATATLGASSACKYEGPGYCRVTMFATDTGGNSVSASRTFSVDWTAPSLSVNSPAQGSWAASSFAMDFSFTDPASGLSSCEYKMESWASSAWNTTRNWTALPCPAATSTYSATPTATVGAAQDCSNEGSGSACRATIRAYDTASNTYSASNTYQIDWTSPSASITSPASGTWQGANFLLAVNNSDSGGSGLSVCRYTVTSSSVQTAGPTAYACGTQPNITVGPGNYCRDEGAGTCVVSVDAADAAGLSASASAVYSIDWTSPATGAINVTNTYAAFVASSFDIASSFTDAIGVNYCDYCLSSDGSCDSEWASASWSSPTCSKTSAACSDGQSLSVNMRAADNSGTASAAAVNFTCDAAAPACSIGAISESAANTYYPGAGPEIWYCNSATCGSGGFSVTLAPSDAGSGVWKADFPNQNNLAGCGDVTIAPYSCAFTFSSSTTQSGAVLETVYDNIGNTATSCSFTLTQDNTAPSGGSIDYGDGYFATAGVAISFTNGSDNGGGSGVSSRNIEWATATLTGGVCGTTWATATWSAVSAAPPAVSPYSYGPLSSGSCNRFRLVETDNTGNSATYSTAATYMVDTNAPTAAITAPASSSWQTAAFSITAANSDTGGSGLSACYYRVLSNTVQTTGWTAYPCAGAPPALSVGAASDCRDEGSGICAVELYSTDAAGSNSSTATSYFSIDWNASVTSSDWASGSWSTATVITITLSPSDAGSGVSSTRHCVDTTDTCDPFTGSAGTSITVSCGAGLACAQYARFASVDNTGHAEAASSTLVYQALGAPITSNSWATSAWTAYSSIDITLSAVTAPSAPVTQDTFYCVDSLNTCAPASTAPLPATVTCAPGSACVQYLRYYSVDATGNIEAPVKSQVVKQDTELPSATTAPAPQADYLATYIGANFSLSETFDDASGSGVSSCDFCKTLDGDCGGEWASATWSQSATSTWGTCSATGLTAADADFLTLNMRAVDAVGNTTTPAAITRTCEAAAPACSLDSISGLSGANIYYPAAGTVLWYCNTASCGATGSFDITAGATDGVAVGYVDFPSPDGLSGCGNDASAPYTCSYSFSSATTHSGAVSVAAYDAVSNSASCGFTLTLDNTPPSGGAISYADGYSAVSSVDVSFTAGADAGVGFSSRKIQKRTGTLTSGLCSGYSAWADLSLNPASSPVNDPAVAVGSCYQYQLLEYDLLNNVQTYTSAAEVKLNERDAPVFAGLEFASDTETGNSVYLSWQAAVDDSQPVVYGIFTRLPSGAYNFAAPAATTTAASTTVSGLTRDQQYFFLVRASDFYGNSEANAVELSATPTAAALPAPPSQLSATFSDPAAALSWTAPTLNADGSPLTDLAGYNVYRGASCQDPAAVKLNSSLIAAPATSYNDPTFSLAATYYYRVTSLNLSGGESAPSDCAQFSRNIQLNSPGNLSVVSTARPGCSAAAGTIDNVITCSIPTSCLDMNVSPPSQIACPAACSPSVTLTRTSPAPETILAEKTTYYSFSATSSIETPATYKLVAACSGSGALDSSPLTFTVNKTCGSPPVFSNVKINGIDARERIYETDPGNTAGSGDIVKITGSIYDSDSSMADKEITLVYGSDDPAYPFPQYMTSLADPDSGNFNFDIPGGASVYPGKIYWGLWATDEIVLPAASYPPGFNSTESSAWVLEITPRHVCAGVCFTPGNEPYPSQAPFRAGEGTLMIGFKMNAPAAVTMGIYGTNGNPICEAGNNPDGDPASTPNTCSWRSGCSWDGMSCSHGNNLVQNGLYIVNISAVAPDGSVMSYTKGVVVMK